MKNWLEKILRDKATDDNGGGGAPKVDAPPPKSDDKPADPPSDPAVKAAGDKLDFYKDEPKADDKKPGEAPEKGDKPKEDSPKKPEKVENPVTGYGDEPPKVDDPPADPPADPPKPPTDLEKKLEGMNDSFKEVTKKMLADLGLEGEKAEKAIAMKKAEYKAAVEWQQKAQAEQERQIKLTRAAWHKELREDPVFGGDKFAINVSRGEKILDEYLPELKKELTQDKRMLPPSVMRGLARIADALYPDDKMVQGDPPPPEGKGGGEEKPLDPLAFYSESN